MRLVLRWSLRIILGIAAVAATAGLGGWAAYEIWLPRTLPQLSGRYEIPGLKAGTTIVRDRNGVPHIYAASLPDAIMALGFVHAQDRLFQMESQRRFGAGRMSEIAGSSTVRLDRFVRILGLYRRAEAAYAELGDETRRLLDAYAAGVNAYLAGRREKLPPEFLAIGMPEPWRPADSLVWGKLMALNLATGWRNELLRLQFLQRFGPEKLEAYFPPYPGDAPSTLGRERAQVPADLRAAPLWAMLSELMPDPGASNEWVVSGARSASGKPLLANDPHLALEAPTVWYLVRIETPELTLAGASVPGIPAIILGHNRRIAWGLTTPYVDAEDLFIERVDPGDSAKYVTPEGNAAFATRTETIRVRFGSDVTLTVRETRHGPVIDDALEPRQLPKMEPGHVLALRAAWLEPGDRTADALLALNRARNWDEFRRALASYTAPAQNFVYADVDGNIGYYLAGRIPIRRSGDGTLPASGWTDERGWTGFIPFEQLPQAYNPATGTIVNANNRVASKSYPYHLSNGWGDHYRATRIETLLGQTARHSPESFARIQGDHVSLMAAELVPLLLAAPPRSLRAKVAQDWLRAWNGGMARDSAEALIFWAWFAEVSRRLSAGLLGDASTPLPPLHPEGVHLLLTRHRDWCASAKAPQRKCEDLIADSLEAALDWIAQRHGGADMTRWRWGDAHYAEMRHRLFGFLPLIGRFGRLTVAADGDGKTINKAATRIGDPKAPFAAREGPGVRAIHPLDDLDRSQFILATGPSGHPASRFYRSMLADWRDIRYVRLAPTRAEAERGAAGIIELAPRR